MLKKRLLVGSTIAAVATGLVVGNLVLGPAFARPVQSPTSVQSAVLTTDDGAASTADNTSDIEEANEATVSRTEAVITSEEAKAIAVAGNPGATVVDVELDSENGVLVYSVELSNGFEVKVDANNGAILSAGQDDADGEDLEQGGVSENESQADEDSANGPDIEQENEDTLPQEEAVISADEAKAIAEAANPGAIVIKTELDNENGVLVCSVELGNGTEVKVDAVTGAIMHTEQNDGDSEVEPNGED